MGYNNKHIVNTLSTQCIGIVIDTTLSWKNLTDKLGKLNKACYAVKAVKSFTTQDRQRTYNITLRCNHETIVAVEMQKVLHICQMIHGNTTKL
jgi:hypothetical protein